MLKHLPFHGILLCVLAVVSVPLAQLQMNGNNHLEYSYDIEQDTSYFEDWTDIYLAYQNWRIGARYEFHLPPQPYSQDSVGQGISQRFLEYKKGKLTFTAGNYYSMFGRGLVLRSFENRMLRWDSNLDGVKFDYSDNHIDFQIIGGTPRDRRGRKHEVLQGGTFNLRPIRLLNAGASFITTHLTEVGRMNWGSAMAGVNLDWGNFYGEWATSDFPENQPPAEALYLMGNVYWGSLTALVEYKDYDLFNLTHTTTQKSPSSELTYNNPPTVSREHLYTLLNRHQLVQNADDEKGYLVELTYSYRDLGVLTFNHSQTDNHKGLMLFREYYGQVEWDPSYTLNFVGGVGEQKDQEARYLNLVGTVKYGFRDYYALKAILEHQHVTIQYNDRQFYNQMLTVSLDRSPDFTLSILGERSTDQESDRDLWLAGQLDIHFLENFDLTVFGGRRREGKVCLGGICIYRPPFEGIEIRLISRF